MSCPELLEYSRCAISYCHMEKGHRLVKPGVCETYSKIPDYFKTIVLSCNRRTYIHGFGDANIIRHAFHLLCFFSPRISHLLNISAFWSTVPPRQSFVIFQGKVHFCYFLVLHYFSPFLSIPHFSPVSQAPLNLVSSVKVINVLFIPPFRSLIKMLHSTVV